MSGRTEKNRTFTASSEDGREFIISQYTDYVDCYTLEALSMIPQETYFRTSTGEEVSRIERGVYEIVFLDHLRVISSDEQAP